MGPGGPQPRCGDSQAVRVTEKDPCSYSIVVFRQPAASPAELVNTTFEGGVIVFLEGVAGRVAAGRWGWHLGKEGTGGYVIDGLRLCEGSGDVRLTAATDRRSAWIFEVRALVWIEPNIGTAIAARIPMTATTIINSMSVKPCWSPRFARLLRKLVTRVTSFSESGG